MKREIDFEILAEKINDSDLYEFVAFSNDVPVEAVNRDLDSIKEALNSHDKIFLEIGFYGYDDEYCDEPYFMFDANESIDDLKDDYYDKYKFMVGGYGIYLDKDLNVEYGYYTTEAPACGLFGSVGHVDGVLQRHPRVARMVFEDFAGQRPGESPIDSRTLAFNPFPEAYGPVDLPVRSDPVVG